jgi:hypothetical protein
VGGGSQNVASGSYATIAGGDNNTAAGEYSYAAGRRAKADHSGVFVWGDDTDADFASTGDNQFLIRASGGVGIGTTSPSRELHVNGDVEATAYYGDGSNLTGISGTADNDWTISGNNIYSAVPGNVGIGTTSPAARLDVNGDINADSLYKIGGTAVLQAVGLGSDVLLAGLNAGMNNTGTELTAIGNSAGINNQGTSNVFVGHTAGYGNTTGMFNTFVGDEAGFPNTTGNSNTYIGDDAGRTNSTGSSNTFVGASSGWFNQGSGNVFIGRMAGYNETGSSKLYIANGRFDENVLMYGDFSTGRIALGTFSPGAKLHVHDSTGTAAYFRATLQSDAAVACYGHAVPGANYDAKGVYGSCIPADWYGYGVTGEGGYTGVLGECTQTGGPGHSYYGVRGSAYLASSDGTAYGVYGSGGGGSAHYGVYYSGGLGGSGKSSVIVRTEEGPKAVYYQESPENWFEDFGSGEIRGGRADVRLAIDFLQTITVDETNPMKVFITPNADIGRWWVEKGTTSFTLMAPEAPENAQFDYRIVAKRRGYEDLRLEQAPGAYADHFLYPDIGDVPVVHQAAWTKAAPATQRTTSSINDKR